MKLLGGIIGAVVMAVAMGLAAIGLSATLLIVGFTSPLIGLTLWFGGVSVTPVDLIVQPVKVFEAACEQLRSFIEARSDHDGGKEKEGGDRNKLRAVG